MRIKKIVLNNFRVYKGIQQIEFGETALKNIMLISGKNGFGKTSFLTSLVWCLYGKMIADVDDKYRIEIADTGGYSNYCYNTYNYLSRTENLSKAKDLHSKLGDATPALQKLLKEKIADLSSFSVELVLTDVNLPSFPCNELVVRRIHNVEKHTETVEIIIDGQLNELSKEVGPDIFINDFLLPKEIAKFFFFDAEKIVSLAETKTAEEKRKLSQAYSEVLGIKKYLELRTNLENMRHRLAKETASASDRAKLDKLSEQVQQKKKLIQHLEGIIADVQEDLVSGKKRSDGFQELLIREGSKVTLKKLQKLKTDKANLAERQQDLKLRVKDMIDLAPFAMVPVLMEKVKLQLEKETRNSGALSPRFINERLELIGEELRRNNKLEVREIEWIHTILHKHFAPQDSDKVHQLLEFTHGQINRFSALYVAINGSYKKEFAALSRDFKFNQSQHLSITQELSNAESKEKDAAIQEIRRSKADIDKEISEKEAALVQRKVELNQAVNESNSLDKQFSELDKKVAAGARQHLKDATTNRLIHELDNFIHQLRVRKKTSLEARLKSTLNLLMHKSDFVDHVNVIIEGEMIDVELYGKQGTLIRKEGLSKGEQQLFATAMLKALVDESSVKFPVFIDSPLQKLDKEHAANIIQHFYPEVSEQVILFPLLGKELSSEEYSWLVPSVADVYLIVNNVDEGSCFERVEPENVLHLIEERSDHVIR